PNAHVQDQAAYKKSQAAQINTILNFIYVMLALAILIALMGIANTLALSIFERTRELGLLRAVGMTRAQLRSTVRWESVIIALFGTVLGLVIGLFFGWALVKALDDQGINILRIPFGSLAVVTVDGGGAAGAGRGGGQRGAGQRLAGLVRRRPAHPPRRLGSSHLTRSE